MYYLLYNFVNTLSRATLRIDFDTEFAVIQDWFQMLPSKEMEIK